MKRKKEQHEENDSTLHQQKITTYANKKYDSDPGSGHRITGVKRASNIWMFLQNPNGVMGKDTWLDDRRALLSLRKWGVDVISLLETNCNWKRNSYATDGKEKFNGSGNTQKSFSPALISLPQSTTTLFKVVLALL